tara:strand:+ start:111 stop:413 length:303 start_codon:yes stop_codon:yes gene_type:complete
MTVARCTECNAPHPDLDFDLYSGFKDTPKICFELFDNGVCKNCFRTTTYEIALEDILKETVLGSIECDLGEGSHRITKLMRDYADKIDAEANKHKHKWDN